MVYFVVGMVEETDAGEECKTSNEFLWNLTGMMFISFQICLLMKYSRVIIN